MEPIRLKPAYKDYEVGGQKLRDLFGKDTPYEITAESWELSCHKDGESIVDTGDCKGMTLTKYIEKMGGNKVVGTNGEKYDRFPLLIKFLDSKENLVVQNHPNDEYAFRVEGEPGKTEMWYFFDADPGAVTYYGFKKDTNEEEFLNKLVEGKLLDLVGAYEVHPGDAMLVNSGTIHALGAGTFSAEVQQNSNTTYRIWNFGKGPGPRGYHIKKAAETLDYSKVENPFLPKQEPVQYDGYSITGVCDCQYFTVDRLDVTDHATLSSGPESFHSILCYEGEGTVSWEGGSFPYKKGDSIFIPANFKNYTITGKMTGLLSKAK